VRKVWVAFALAATGFFLPRSAHGQGYKTVAVANGGTISGTVKWEGPLPHVPTLAINKDPQICDPASHKVRDLERIIIGPQGGIANTVVYLKDISTGKAMDIAPQRQFLDQRNCRYEPHILLVPRDATLQMKSSDATLHTVHMDGAATYNLPFPFPNQVVSRQMSTPGLVNLKCNGGHTWMNAEVFVVLHPYYAVTDENGKFELSDVPPGEYTIVAWHESWKVVGREASFDVLTERKVERPVFTPPRTWEKSVSVGSNRATSVSFLISEK
jgi:hypothetical protein